MVGAQRRIIVNATDGLFSENSYSAGCGLWKGTGTLSGYTYFPP